MAMTRTELLSIDAEDCDDSQSRVDSHTNLLALPAYKGGKRRRMSARVASKTDGRIVKAQMLRKTLLLSWIARLRYLHSACSHPLIQALVLSVWGGFRFSSPSLSELLERFKVTVVNKSAVSGSPLLGACYAARWRKGTPIDLAICFVALCRALDIPARLVLAMDPSEASSANVQTNTDSHEKRSPEVSASLQHSLDAHGQNSASCFEPPDTIQLDDDDDDDSNIFQKQLEAMGFSRDAALSALVQSEQEGASDILSRATEILLEYDAKTNSGNRCSRCGEAGAQGSFCGRCGQRIKRGGPSGAADSKKALQTTSQEEDDTQPVVTAWPEAYDLESGRWVAVDLVFGFLAAEPRVEWMHRGVPMLWVCSADDGLRGSSGHCILRDVTPRYSPSWWRVEKARGNRAVQRWWEEEALHSMSTWQPIQLALAGDATCCDGGVAAAEIAADADERDVEALTARRNSDAMPNTKGGLKHHKRYVLKEDLGRYAVLKPDAKAVNLVAGTPVYLRSDVARALSAAQWQKLGRRPRPGEQPCKPAKARVNSETTVKVTIGDGPLFAEWQTEVEDGLVLQPIGSTPERKRKGIGRLGKAFKAFAAAKSAPKLAASRKRKSGAQKDDPTELSLPALPAPRKAKAKTKSGLKLAFRMPAFKDALQKLGAWFDEFGFMPFDRSHDARERHLGLWVRKVLAAYGQRRLSQEQIDMLEKLDQWEWGDTEGGPAIPGEEPSSGSPSRPEEKSARRASGFAGPDSEAMQAEQQTSDSSMQQWSQLTMQRLASQLAKQPDVMARRTCLRTWQRVYHPDKNPGRADEVLPIFRWVQSKWDHDFRTSDNADLASMATAKAQAPASRSSAPKHEPCVNKRTGATDSHQEALIAPARRRITGKRSVRDL